jgi:hypothetical protein
MIEKICLHKLNNECKSCLPDFDKRHHPNNYDCVDYEEVDIIIREVKSYEFEAQKPVNSIGLKGG